MRSFCPTMARVLSGHDPGHLRVRRAVDVHADIAVAPLAVVGYRPARLRFPGALWLRIGHVAVLQVRVAELPQPWLVLGRGHLAQPVPALGLCSGQAAMLPREESSARRAGTILLDVPRQVVVSRRLVHPATVPARVQPVEYETQGRQGVSGRLADPVFMIRPCWRCSASQAICPVAEAEGCLVSGPGPAGTSRFARWPRLPRGCRAGAGRRGAGPRRSPG